MSSETLNILRHLSHPLTCRRLVWWVWERVGPSTLQSANAHSCLPCLGCGREGGPGSGVPQRDWGTWLQVPVPTAEEGIRENHHCSGLFVRMLSFKTNPGDSRAHPGRELCLDQWFSTACKQVGKAENCRSRILARKGLHMYGPNASLSETFNSKCALK